MQVYEVLQHSKKSLNEKRELKETNQILTKKVTSSLSEIKSELKQKLSLFEDLVLKEDLDLRQVSGGDWMVWDTETNSPAATTRFASPGEAEEYRDTLRAQRTSTGGDDDRRDNNSNRNRSRVSRAFTYGYRRRFQGFGRIQSYRSRLVSSWTYLLAGAMGITIDHTSIVADLVPDGGKDDRSFEAYLDDVYLYAEAGFLYNPDGLDQEQMIARMNAMTEEEINDHADKNHKEYEKYVLRSYGVVVAAYQAALILQLITSGGAIKNIRKFIQALRAIRLTATAISAGVGAAFGAGVGGIVTGLIAFILGSAFIWAAEYALVYSGLGPSIVRYIVEKTLEWDMENAAEGSVHGISAGDMLDWAASSGDFVGITAANVIADIPGTTEIQRNLKNIRSEILHDPRANANADEVLRYFDDMGVEGNGQAGGNGTANGNGNGQAGGNGTANGNGNGQAGGNGTGTNGRVLPNILQ